MTRSAAAVTVQALLLVAAVPFAASAQRELLSAERVDNIVWQRDRSAQMPRTLCRRGANDTSAQVRSMIVRISEIEVDPIHLDEYKSILGEEAAASVRLEPGVVSIFPMYEKERPTQFRILEIYASREAYESHLLTPHFQRYKTTTLNMVKSLRLVDMGVLDTATMARIFHRIERRE